MLESFKTIVKNTVIIYSAEMLSRVFQFVFIIYAARTLGVEFFGDLSYAITVYLLIQVLSDFGFSVFLTREVASNPVDRDRMFYVALRLRFFSTIFVCLLFTAYLYIIKHSPEIRLFVIVTGISLVLSSYAQNFVLTLRGLNLMKLDGAIRVSGTFLSTMLSLAALRAGADMTGIAFSIFFGNMLMIVLSLWINNKYGIIKTQISDAKLSDYLSMARMSLPFITLVILSSIFQRVDTLLLQHLKGPVEVGLYHAAFKVTEAFLLFQTAFAMVLLPVLSGHMADEDTDAAKKITQLGIKYMAFIGIFLAVIVFLTSDKIVEILYFSPEYSKAVPGLQIFAFVNLLLYVSTPVGYLILSSRFAHFGVWIQFLMVFFSVSLNLVLIPGYGFKGAALVRLLTELLGLTVTVFFINKYIFRINFLADFWRPLLAGAVIGAFVYFAKSLLFLPFYLMLYVIALYFLRAISQKEVAFIKDLVIEKFKKTGF